MSTYLRIVFFLVCACGTVTASADPWSSRGPHAVVVDTDLGPKKEFVVFRPAEMSVDAPRPIVVFCIGTGAKPKGYTAMLEHWASHGFFVIAGNDPQQANGEQAARALAWAIEQNKPGGRYAGMLDPQAIAASGHSQGGNAALHLALREPRVRSVLALQPGGGGAAKLLDAADQSKLKVPVFYICGGRDMIVPPKRCNARFDGTPERAWVGIVKRATHFALTARRAGKDNIHIRRHGTRWLHAHTRGDENARAGFYGRGFALGRDKAWRAVRRK